MSTAAAGVGRGRFGPVPAESRMLADLLEVSATLGSGLDLKAALARTLDALADARGTLSACVALVEGDGGDAVLIASSGVPWQVARRARYRPGEGIIGRVVASGRPVVVARITQEPLFLNRTGILDDRSRGEMTFVCVPIVAERRTVGALGITLPHEEHRDYDRESKFFAVVAALLGHALQARRPAADDRAGRPAAEAPLADAPKAGQGTLASIVGNSPPMQAVYRQVAQVAASSTTALVRGESGTGKEKIAQAIHEGSSRAGRPFVAVSCGALPESLIESELFGYEAGAFTGARGQKKGRFELAHGGTLFLDEVGEFPLSIQVKLLRVLQERQFERLGGTQPVKVDVRLVAATHKDLEAAVRQGTFREDLYYRLNVFSIFVPPLRDRKTDVLLLADHFVEKFARALGKEVRRIATSAIDMLMTYHWPGNVRELENCIERAVVVCDGGTIHAHHLPPTLQTAEASGTVRRASLEKAVEALERDLILDALKTTRGNRARAARLLGSTERIVTYKIRKYEIDPARFRSGDPAHA